MVAGDEPARSDHNKKWRKIEEQNRARRRRPDEAAVNQQEFKREQRAGENAGTATCRRA